MCRPEKFGKEVAMVISTDAGKTNPKELFKASEKVREEQGKKTMTFEKWMDEISKGQLIRSQEIRTLDCTLYDAFDEDERGGRTEASPIKEELIVLLVISREAAGAQPAASLR